MSGLLVQVGALEDGSAFEAALYGMRELGGDATEITRRDNAMFGVTRKAWQLSSVFSGNTLVLEDNDLVVAADASIYGASRLIQELRSLGHPPRGTTPSHLIAASYRAWGNDLARHLNGDFAFVVWDAGQQRLLAARDTMGSRPLYWARHDSGIALASSSRVLAELVGREQLNLANLGGLIAGLVWSAGTDTAFDGVETVSSAHVLTWSRGMPRQDRFWNPRLAPEPRPVPAQEAAEELRARLEQAVIDRLEPDTTTVWMSGGWDSTAVYAAGMNRLRRDRSPHELVPVSIAYPDGDPGDEGALIALVSKRWDAAVRWLPSAEIPLLENLAERAAASDEPPTHMYELWNRALARKTRECGSRVALDGNGGDQLFGASDVILADHLRRGRFRALIRHARAKRSYGRRYIVDHTLGPLVPTPIVRVSEALTGRRMRRHYLERRMAPWVRSDFARQAELRERDLATLRRDGDSLTHSETLSLLTMPLIGWNFSYMRGRLLQEGVESRSPLLDPAVMELALARPVSERVRDRETKILLRAAMHGLLPPAFLAPRPYRTGTTVGYSKQKMREGYPSLLKQMFSEPLRVAELGIVDPAKLRIAATNWESDDWVRVNLFSTMRVEFWLRGLDRKRSLGIDGAGRPPAERLHELSTAAV